MNMYEAVCSVSVHPAADAALVRSPQTARIHMVTVDSCFSFNKIRLKKLVVHSLICHLTEGATWGLPYPVHSEWLIRDGLIHTGTGDGTYVHRKASSLQADKLVIPQLKGAGARFLAQNGQQGIYC